MAPAWHKNRSFLRHDFGRSGLHLEASNQVLLNSNYVYFVICDIIWFCVFFSLSWQTQKVEFADWHVSLRSKVGFEWWVSGWRRHHGTLQPNAYCPDLSWIEGLASSELECKCIVQKKQNIYSTCAHFRTRSMQRFIPRRNVMVPAMWKRNL